MADVEDHTIYQNRETGGSYYVTCVASHHKTGERCVVYQKGGRGGEYLYRSLDSFRVADEEDEKGEFKKTGTF
ncbi:MAG: hypothetical protein A2946_00500 [Candidatus Liptonbacteria bacterium RIFCSPLOWO2_01_FULL_53_13]|uniref:Uncharacterized protein n=1 Tax=Candidatus Liptonbacteria bacterium RIFCSPLOWO2_01_FULL_53_13 TaxID=1798651 RepID=A0A1G2CGX2_9BACT|nr:MAG: hypothetical protein A2946_00500 [Candidatus Liptonbacteria bacterium RIFCSPLOWO2_01_FULL_53_13]